MIRKILLALPLLSTFTFAQTESVDMNKTSYAIGVQSGILLSDNIKRSADVGIHINKEALMKGFFEALNDKATLSYDDALPYLQELDALMQKKESEYFAKVAAENKEVGKAYQTKQSQLANIQTTASGIQYKVLKEGSGKQPLATSSVTVHYKGTLIDGTEFDNSYKRGEPATFPLNGVIKGWTEALQLMKEGAMYELTIPSDLAYGDQGNPNIPPGATLIFVVELLSVQ